jgi:hypothetical protein
LLIVAPGGIEDYFSQISAAADDAERELIGERYSIRVVPEPAAGFSRTEPAG